MKKKFLVIYLFANAIALNCFSQQDENTIWNIGKADNSVSEFALAPGGFKNFVGKDFGYEDKYFLVGYRNSNRQKYDHARREQNYTNCSARFLDYVRRNKFTDYVSAGIKCSNIVKMCKNYIHVHTF